MGYDLGAIALPQPQPGSVDFEAVREHILAKGKLMQQLWLSAKLDIVESLDASWFQIYTLVFGGIVALLFLFGLTESRVLGFIGLSRLLVTYVQLTMAILPIFILITTVRSMAGDREAGVHEC